MGLTTVIIIGVPALMFAINTLGNATDLERADTFASRLLNETRLVDIGATNNTEIATAIPDYVTISVNGNTLVISFSKEGLQETQWTDTYLHPISLQGSISGGQCLITIRQVAGVIEIMFVSL